MKKLENIKLVLDIIENNPNFWYQRAWHCDISHCFGGWAQVLSGKELSNLDNIVRRDARIFFGFNIQEANYYFSADRTLDELKTALLNFYDEQGFGRDGYDRDGFNQDGFNQDGYDRDGFNQYGYDRYGFNRGGFDLNGFDLNGFDRYGFDRNGFNVYGFNRNGFDRNGYDRNGFDRDQLDKNNNPKPEEA